MGDGPFVFLGFKTFCELGHGRLKRNGLRHWFVNELGLMGLGLKIKFGFKICNWITMS